jgi:hypothetical protein
MKCRIAVWASAGFLAAGWWALYFFWANKDTPTDPIVYALIRLTCPIAIAGVHFPISLYWVLVANAATYALVGLIAETLRRQFHPAK